MKATMHTVYLILAAALSTTLFAYLKIFGVGVNLFLIYLVIAGFYVSQTEAIRLGLIFGFVFDILVGSKIGLCAVTYMLACFFVTLLCENMIRRTNALIVFLCTLLWTVVFEGISAILSSFGGFLNGLTTLGIEALYNGGAAVILYFLLRRLFERIYGEKGE